jgi:hypothetical protein
MPNFYTWLSLLQVLAERKQQVCLTFSNLLGSTGTECPALLTSLLLMQFLAERARQVAAAKALKQQQERQQQVGAVQF